MVQQKSRIISVAIGIFFLLLVTVGILIAWIENRPMGVIELWQIESENKNLEGKTVLVRGDVLFDPFSDFRFNAIYLVDPETPSEYRTPSHGFWFGIRIDGVSCIVDTVANLMTCEPFDPSQATAFEFKGMVHLEQIGKKEIMWLSDIDFEHSRQWMDGKWQPIPLGKFILPLEKD